mgnify:CR=1 FL=1
MNCNTEAFDWIISVVKLKTNYRDGDNTEVLTQAQIDAELAYKFQEVNAVNCLNKLVTSYFL